MKDLSGLYRQSMRRHRFGYALYEPAPFTRLHPGMLGFLDDYQHWHPILDLTDTPAVQAAGFTPLGRLQRSEPDVRRHGPLTADSVAETSVELGAGVDAAALGLPAGVDGSVRYSTAGGFGAVLMCDGEVVSEGFDFRDPFLVWMKRNAKALFGRYPHARKHGICTATWTYSATDIHIKAWKGGDNAVTVGFNVGAAGVGRVGSQVSWSRGRMTSGWSEWTDQKRVVFFTGVMVRAGIFGAREQQEKNWRGTDETFVVEDEVEGYVKFGLELFGDNWYDIEGV